MGDFYVPLGFTVNKTVAKEVDRLAMEQGLSRAKYLNILLEEALTNHGARLEVTTTNPNGTKHKSGAAITVNNMARRVL